MKDWNLPPGTTPNDLPGNRDEDVDAEARVEALLGVYGEQPPTALSEALFEVDHHCGRCGEVMFSTLSQTGEVVNRDEDSGEHVPSVCLPCERAVLEDGANLRPVVRAGQS